ncbi:ISAs1 family transposase [Streptomyces luteireticuli]|uniref:ISAs1 family transposase n=1 Tax=Streptomyces luteireticuli TaxID=173858 RepID=UPI003558AD09
MNPSRPADQQLSRSGGTSLPRTQCTARRYNRDGGHGRQETRSVRVLTVTGMGIDFPHTAQAAKILRYRTDAKTGKTTRQTVYAITDLTSHQASPQQIGYLARAQWVIENRLHHVRDTTPAEDASKIRTGHGPENMATLRNPAVNTLRDAGHHNIATGLRETSCHPLTHPLDLLHLTRPAPTPNRQDFESALRRVRRRHSPSTSWGVSGQGALPVRGSTDAPPGPGNRPVVHNPARFPPATG